jgi:hypothetical protein
MIVTVYLRTDGIYMPTILRTIDGVSYESDPVITIDVSDGESLTNNIVDALKRGVTTVERPNWKVLPLSSMIAATRAKSYRAFAMSVGRYSIIERDNGEVGFGWYVYNEREKAWEAIPHYFTKTTVQNVKWPTLAREVVATLQNPPSEVKAVVQGSGTVRKPSRSRKQVRR